MILTFKHNRRFKFEKALQGQLVFSGISTYILTSAFLCKDRGNGLVVIAIVVVATNCCWLQINGKLSARQFLFGFKSPVEDEKKEDEEESGISSLRTSSVA